LKRYVADTVALIHYMAGSLPSRADRIFRQAEEGAVGLIIPPICIGEFIYVVLKQRRLTEEERREAIDLLVEVIASSDNIIYAPLRINTWRNLAKLDVPELHDRIVVATHLQEKTEAIITNDPTIGKAADTVW